MNISFNPDFSVERDYGTLPVESTKTVTLTIDGVEVIVAVGVKVGVTSNVGVTVGVKIPRAP